MPGPERHHFLVPSLASVRERRCPRGRRSVDSKKMAEREDRLRYLKAKYRLKHKDIAALLGVEWTTVVSWLRPESGAAKRNMPGNLLELLEYKLGERTWTIADAAAPAQRDEGDTPPIEPDETH